MQRSGRQAASRQRGDRLLAARLVPRAQQDDRAPFGELPGDLESEALVGPGDQGDLVTCHVPHLPSPQAAVASTKIIIILARYELAAGPAVHPIMAGLACARQSRHEPASRCGASRQGGTGIAVPAACRSTDAGQEPLSEELLMTYQTSVLVPRDPAGTFDLMTQPGGLRRWQAITARAALRAGGAYRCTIAPGRTAIGSFAEVEPAERLVLTRSWEGGTGDQAGTCALSFTLAPASGGTMVRLTHEGPAGNGADLADGWAHYLARLAEAAARGDAGPDDRAVLAPDADAISCTEAALAVCQRVLRDVPPDALDRPTPCPEYSVRQLADHLSSSIVFFGDAAGAQAPATEASAAAPGDPETLIADAAQLTLETWRARGLDGSIRMRGRDMPAGLALGILCVELLVHAWDFGQALDRSLVVAEPLARHVLRLARATVTPDLRARGSFADPVGAAAGVPAFDQLIAFTGRTPGR
jgi:uncharacterized protein (TIGR03086 family)